MVKTKNIIKVFITLIYTSGAILAAERRSEADPTSPCQVLTIELKTLTPGFGLETLFRDEKSPASTHERDLAEQAYWIAESMLHNKEGEKALAYVGYSLYLGYPRIIDTIYTIGFRKNRYVGFSSAIEQQIKDKFLEGCKMHGISSSPYLSPLRSKYEKAWEENKQRIEQMEADQKELERARRWWTLSGLLVRAQDLLASPEAVSPVGVEETVATSEKDSKKRIRSKDYSVPEHPLKSVRPRKVLDDETQPLLQADETVNSPTLESKQESVRQRKVLPAGEHSPSKQAEKTVNSSTGESKKKK